MVLSTARTCRQPSAFRLRIESLEDRLAPNNMLGLGDATRLPADNWLGFNATDLFQGAQAASRVAADLGQTSMQAAPGTLAPTAQAPAAPLSLTVLAAPTRAATDALALVVGSFDLPTLDDSSIQGGYGRVHAPNSRPYGLSYSQWSAVWWQWALAIPAEINPLLDETGERIRVGQVFGPVWFLAGVFNESGSAVRSGTVPAGKSLLFPVLNVEFDNIDCSGGPDTDFSFRELRQFAREAADSAEDLHVRVDGQPVQNLNRFRFQTPSFAYAVPPGSLLTEIGCKVQEPRIVNPAAGDGFYVMLQPLPVGQHTVRFGGTFTDVGFTLDVTYHLNVVR